MLEDPHFDGKPATVILRGLGELSRLRARSFDTGWAWAFASAFGTNRLETQSGEGAPCAILALGMKLPF